MYDLNYTKIIVSEEIIIYLSAFSMCIRLISSGGLIELYSVFRAWRSFPCWTVRNCPRIYIYIFRSVVKIVLITMEYHGRELPLALGVVYVQ